MKNFLFGLLSSIAIALPAIAALEAGDTAPTFEAKASLAGKSFDYSLREALDEVLGANSDSSCCRQLI